VAPAKRTGNVALAFAAFVAAQRHGAERAQSQVHLPELAGVTDATVDDHAGPAILHGGAAELVAEQRAAS
jgi:hypothetical protein